MTGLNLTVLVVEDGDEYIENLSRFIKGPEYLQAHSGGEALEVLARRSVDLVYLDMRFDRIPEEALFGDHDRVMDEHNGDADRAWKYLMNHQGLFILAAFKKAGFGALPVVLAYDFTDEPRRYDTLKRQYPNLTWVSDAVSFTEIQRLFESLSRQTPAARRPVPPDRGAKSV